VIGAIGVSGASSAQQDEEIALAGAAAIDAVTQDKVSYFDARTVEAAFTKGTSLLQTATYKVNPSRRDGPGEAEVHTHDTDVFYVLSGGAEFVTGGELVGERNDGNGEWRGNAIKGGETRRLGTGDIIVIPAGVPHWFKQVDDPLIYYVVKSASPTGGL
jgi:glc operon protein GlcG